MSLGAFLLHADALLLAAAVALVLILLRGASRSWRTAAAAGTAFAVMISIGPVLSPFDPAMLLAAAATALALDSGRPGSETWVLAGFCATALLNPGAGIALAICAGAYAFVAWHREPRTMTLKAVLLAPILVSAAAAASALSVPPLPSQTRAAAAACFQLPSLVSAPAPWLAGARAAVTAAGPYAFGLTALGAFILLRRSVAARWLLAYAVAASLAADATGAVPMRTFGALVVAVWVWMAAGLAELQRACGAAIRGRIAAAALLVLLPLLQVPRALAAPPPPPTRGVAQLSANDVRHILAQLPARAVLVREDATVDILLRALNRSEQRLGKALGLVAADADAISSVIRDDHRQVFALPLAQSDLQWRGVAFADAHLLAVTGVALVQQAVPCERVKPRWRELPLGATIGARVFSTIPRGPSDEEHPVIYYASAAAEPHPAAMSWPANAGGLDQRTYDVTNAARLKRLQTDLRQDQFPDEDVERLGPFVARVALWRSWGRAEFLSVDFGVVPVHLFARSPAPAGLDLMCAAFPYDVQPVRARR